MKKILIIISMIMMAAIIFGCSRKGIKAPGTEGTYIDSDWNTVKEEFEKAGFTNITVIEDKDIGPDSDCEVGSVESISINGDSSFSVDTEFDKDVAVEIKYHALAEFKAEIHINFVGNWFFDKYDIDFCIDGEKKSMLKHGEDLDTELEMTCGKHVMTFAKTDNSDLKGEVKIDVTSDLEAEYTINCHSEEISVTTEYVDYKINLSENQLKVTKTSDEYKYKNYKDVVADLQSMGFTNIKEVPIYDIMFGITKDGETEAVSVNGIEGFNKGEVFDKGVEVVVSFHTYEEKDPSVIAEKERKEESQKSEEVTEEETFVDKATTTEEKVMSDEETGMDKTITKEEKSDVKEENKVLTVDNCEDLAVILSSKEENSPLYEDFSEKYFGNMITFDGRIDYITNYYDYKTRWDILVSAGDYDPDTQTGPSFKFENVGSNKLDNDLFVGMNVRIIAKVGKYNINTGLFFLDYVSITER